MTELIARCSTIFIATREDMRVYHSVSEVPVALRQKLEISTRGMNSATILIADRRGREELIRALKGEANDLLPVLAGIKSRRQTDAPLKDACVKQESRPLLSVRRWLELFIPVIVGAWLWLLSDSHF